MFRMPLELEFKTDGDPEFKRVDVSGSSSDFDVLTDRRPKEVLIDPRKNVLRLSSDIRISVFISRGEEFANDNEYNRGDLMNTEKAIDLQPHNSARTFSHAVKPCS